MAVESVRQYESMIIFSSRLTDAQLKDEIKKVEGILNSNAAQNVSVDAWGRREAAYALKKDRFGHFVCVKYESGNHQLPNVIGSLLRITESVHKFQTHVINTKTRKFKGNPRRQAGSSDGFEFDDSGDSYE